MKRKNMATATIGLVLVAVLAAPQPVQARDKDWARAGKILTGLAIFGALAHVVQAAPLPPPPPVMVREPVMIHPVPPSRYGRIPPPPPRYERLIPPPSGRYHSPRGPAGGNAGGEIVVQIGRDRRVFQPAVRGHVAFLQEWCPRRGAWITIGSHPSVWR